MKVLVIGASGMIGSTILRKLSEEKSWKVHGTVRNLDSRKFFDENVRERIEVGLDVNDPDALTRILDTLQPDVVINCAGLTKHKIAANDPLISIPINSLMPHRLAGLCGLNGARLIHISTDCVFAGTKGNYTEEDFTDARDVYGKSKALGEVTYPHTITLRTSTIGHEIQTCYGLLEWFLSQKEGCKGYKQAIFSGLPTVIFSQIIKDVVIPQTDLTGIYHVAAEPISKFDLLELVAKVYNKKIDIQPDESLVLDRSLNASRFQKATGYLAPSWDHLIQTMHQYR